MRGEGGTVDYSLWPSCVAASVAAVVSAIAAVTDYRSRRIPNALVLPSFVAGVVFRLAAHGFTGLADAGLAFAVGFGTLFVLWIAGGGAAGDVKLMGALSVWLGFPLTLSVLVGSVAVVVVLTFAAPLFPNSSRVVASSARPGDMPSVTDGDRMSDRPVPGSTDGGDAGNAVSARKLTVAFAIPVAIATWTVLALDVAGVEIPFLPVATSRAPAG